MDRRGDEFLAGAGFTLDQDRHHRLRDRLDVLENGDHAPVPGHDRFEHLRMFELVLQEMVTQPDIFVVEFHHIERASDGVHQPVLFDRFYQVIESALPHAVHGGFNVRHGGHHDHLRPGRGLFYKGQEFRAGPAGHEYIEHHGPEFTAGYERYDLFGVRGD